MLLNPSKHGLVIATFSHIFCSYQVPTKWRVVYVTSVRNMKTWDSYFPGAYNLSEADLQK